MGGLSIWHWLVVGIVVMLLFGKGRFSDMMGDVAKGIKSFKKGMSEEESDAATTKPAKPAQKLEAKPTAPAAEPEPVREEQKQG
ncbi:MAG TPA: twin-arginine translocase TatA/TatE family subunit [Sphingobium sp.]|nr:twin-arginine translocase TatA/TatE family subunit [Sphingobium sp.]